VPTVDFYHLTRDPVERVIPSIAARVLDGGGRLLVVAQERERLERISEALWSAGEKSYLAHDYEDQPLPEVQPVLLSLSVSANGAALNGARLIALADGEWRGDALGFERIFHFFDEETIGAARSAWRSLSERDDVERRYWKQDGGRWRQGP
jgi:DNA polymerase-3 subunit chi